MPKRALITGITGQDGAYLSQFLLSKGYIVSGTSRNISQKNLWRLNYLNIINNVKLYKSSNLDKKNIINFLKKVKPDEIYNLSGISSVSESFKNPVSTFKANTSDCIMILDSIFQLDKPIKFYQASSSDMFGDNHNKKCSEKTSFNPKSPYAISKLSAHQITINYRNNFAIYASTGILFNHESPLRGGKFVTKKIISGLVKIKMNKIKIIKVGNIDAKRDWGHSSDFIKSMYLILQQNKPDDFVISSGENYSVKEMIDITCQLLKIRSSWKGRGSKRILIDNSNNKIIVKIDNSLLRPRDIKYISGDTSKAKAKLKWKPQIAFKKLIQEMIDFEISNL